MNTTPQLIGLTGQKGSGKSTTAKLLRNHLPFSFATPIKKMLMAMGLTWHEVHDPAAKEITLPRFGKSPREMMQTLGTQWGRQMVADNHWISIAKREFESTLARGVRVCFDDVRFDNEAKMIRDLGGVIWKIEDGKKRPATHEAEKGVSPELIDAEILNIGTSDDLNAAVSQLVGYSV